MSETDRVGQLFVVAFTGNDTAFNSTILELIYAYRIGGVVLTPRNGNFSNAKGEDTPRQVAILTNRLQGIAYGVLLPEGAELQPVPNEPWPPPNMQPLPEMTNGVRPPNLPLLVAVEQSGDTIETTALRRGFSELPSPLALGSTWQPDLARQVGVIIGRELQAVGVNMLLGPSLDVLDQPSVKNVGRLGVQMFGGNPKWVAQIGKAYIAGVHQGSNGRLATMARHFPGQGDADRLPDEEVATIQTGREQLQQEDLAPFLAVTSAATDAEASGAVGVSSQAAADWGVTDGMIASHMRYSALQGVGSIRIPPLSLAPELGILLQQPEFVAWRQRGGVMMSAPLGSPAIRRFYESILPQFPPLQVARATFIAGNDLLLLDYTAPETDPSANVDPVVDTGLIKTTIGFFQEEYKRDQTFAKDVDNAVRRILRLKLRLYGWPQLAAESGASGNPDLPPIPLSQVLAQEGNLAALALDQQEQARAVLNQVAREAITALHPDPQPLSDLLPEPPLAGEKLLIFTDSRLLRECATCTTEAAIGPDELGKIINRFYGPDGSEEIAAEQITSLTFGQLAEVLVHASDPVSSTVELLGALIPITTTAGTTQSLPGTTQGADANTKDAKTEALIANADWLIFAMLDVDPEREPASKVLLDFLDQRSEQLADKRLIVFAFGPPYFLDATQIDRITAFYGLYSRGEAFQESAVRALFRGYTPSGAPAVSVAGTRFSSLANRLAPDSVQVIPLQVLGENHEVLLSSLNRAAGLEAGAPPEIASGASITIQVGPVLDANRHLVVDGTPFDVEMLANSGETVLINQRLLSRSGVATATIALNNAGIVQIVALVDKANSGPPLVLNVRPSAIVAPTALLTNTAATHSQANVNSNGTAEQPTEPAAVSLPTANNIVTRRIDLTTLLFSLLTIMVVLSGILLTQTRLVPRPVLVNSMCWAVVVGLGVYILYGLGWLPGSGWMAATLQRFGAPVVVFLSMLIPLLWLQLRDPHSS